MPATHEIQRIRDLDTAVRRTEVAKLVGVLDWVAAFAMSPSEDGPSEVWWTTNDAMYIGGEGSPQVRETDALDVCAALGMSTPSGLSYLSSAVELRYRLPRIYEKVLAGNLPVWRAFRITEQTASLSFEAATYIDQQVHWVAHKISWAQLDRLITAAIIRFDPAQAEADQAAAAERRHVTIWNDPHHGTVEVSATLDLLDAHDLQTALQAGAARLADAGCDETLDVRRSIALGELARGDQTLDLDLKRREIVVHLHQDAGDVGRLDLQPVTVEQIRQWCSDAAKVTVKPVIDLNESVSVVQYEIPDRIRARVELLHPTCVFPHCGRRSSRCDLDHLIPYDSGGPTSTGNLAPLCRRHHRMKTTGRWRYHPDPDHPGHFVWTSPAGQQLRTGHHGTTPLT